MKRAIVKTTAAVLLCGGLLSACGSSGDSGATAQSAPAAADAATGGSSEALLAQSLAAAPAEAAAGAAADTGAAAADTGAAAATDTTAADPSTATRSASATKAAKNAAKVVDKASTGKGVKSAVSDTALDGRDIIYTADMTVRVKNVETAASQVESAANAAGGIVVNSDRSVVPAEPQVASEDGDVPARTTQDRSSATLKLRVPPAEFDSVLARIGKTGDVLGRNLTGKDVTAEVVDVKSRVASQRKSVTRIRELMEQANSLRDIVSLESEVAQREAELDSLLAKQAKLRDQSSLATITVRLVTPEQPAEAVPLDADEAGFAAGLTDGWEAFTAALVVAATVLGALLPFAVAMAVLVPPLVWFVARMRKMAAAPNPHPES